MGCAQSTDKQHAEDSNINAARQKDVAVKKGPVLTQVLTAQMSMGENLDEKQTHSELIEKALADAREELVRAKERWFWDFYNYEEELLGRGAFARVYKGECKATRRTVAIKLIPRDNAKFFERQKRGMVNKVSTMRCLREHRNMVQLIDIFEEPEGYYIILEYMNALPLLDAIVRKGHFSERSAAHVMRQLLQFMTYMHAKNVVHRDIKPENLMLFKPRSADNADRSSPVYASNGTGDADSGLPRSMSRTSMRLWSPAEHLTEKQAAEMNEALWADVPDGLRLKVIDWGIAHFCEANQHLHSKVGTARYMAPEVLKRDYDKSSDIWSAGVVMYILLVGHSPFEGSTETAMLKEVKEGHYSMDGIEWEGVSQSAKDMVRHMLVLNPSERWTAEELLQHPWFKEALEGQETQEAPLANGYLDRLRTFNTAKRMQRLALKLLAAKEMSMSALSHAEVARLKQVFSALDTDGDGLIDGKSLHAALEEVGGAGLSEKDVQEFLRVSQVDGHHTGDMVDPSEFVAALFNAGDVASLHPGVLDEEFEELDGDHDGVITAADLVAASKSKRVSGEFAALTLAEAEEMLLELRGGPDNTNPGSSAPRVSEAGSSMNNRPGTPVPGITKDEFKDMMLRPRLSKKPTRKESIDGRVNGSPASASDTTATPNPELAGLVAGMQAPKGSHGKSWSAQAKAVGSAGSGLAASLSAAIAGPQLRNDGVDSSAVDLDVR